MDDVIGEVSALKAAQISVEGQVAVTKKGLDQEKTTGSALIETIENVPTPRDLHPTGQALNVTA